MRALLIDDDSKLHRLGLIQTRTLLHNFERELRQKGRSPYAEGKPDLSGLGARPAPPEKKNGTIPCAIVLVRRWIGPHRLLGAYLSDRGVQLEGAFDGQRGLIALDRDTWDVVLLDVMMPGMDGLEVCRRIRAKSAVPVIMLTARGDEADRVVGLELGADDYVAKPFSPRELLARIRAVTRRGQHAVGERLSTAEIVADLAGRSVTRFGVDVPLTGLEFDLLVALMRRAGRVVSREALLSGAGRADPREGRAHL